MINKRKIGSFYTPQIIADFLVDYLTPKLKKENLTVLEPSSGDGIFVKSIYKHKVISKNLKRVLAVEREVSELKKVRKITANSSLETINSDFLDFQNNNNDKFDLVIGNPPYFKKNFLSKKQQDLSKLIFKSANLSHTSAKNIWATFFVRCISFTNSEGVMALILPSDLKQVSFAKELRELLKNEFERIELFTFKELLFQECKGQDTVLLIAERKSTQRGVFTCDIESTNQLLNGSFAFKEEVRVSSSNWNHEHLSSDEFEFIERIKSNLSTINFYTNAKPGVVTGANNYFIVDDETVANFGLEELVKPIIQKGIYVNGSVSFSKADLNKLSKQGKATNLIYFDDANETLITKLNRRYLSLEETNALKKRYKLRDRKVWYRIPNVSSHADGLFFKRSHNYPKLLKNEAKVLATDAAYYVNMREGYYINDLVFSFYNSATLAVAELTGRYYGGGVLEMVPTEFKSLPIPFMSISENDFKEYKKAFKTKETIHSILNKYDNLILGSVLNFRSEEISKIQNIHSKLVSKRLRIT